MLTKKSAHEAIDIHVDEHGILIIRYRGQQNTAHAIALREMAEKAIAELRRKGKDVHILLDVTELKYTKSTSGSRTEFKKMAQFDFDAAAIVANRGLAQLVSYIIKGSNRRHRIRFFSKEHKAIKWLLSTSYRQKNRSRSCLVAGLSIEAIAILALVGWSLNNPHLTRLLLNLRPVNPVTAIGLLILSSAFIGLGLERRKLVKVASVATGLIGLTGIFRLPVGTLLFANAVKASHSNTHVSISAGICFLALSFILLTRRKYHRITSFVAATICGLAVFNIYGSLYAQHALYSLSSSVVLSLPSTFAFLIASVAILSLQTREKKYDFIHQTTASGWIVLASFVLFQVVTYSSWSQSIQRNNLTAKASFDTTAQVINNNLNSGIQSYLDILNGFKGLYISSSYVSQGEFASYFKSLDAPVNYPGLRSTAFISRVTSAELPSFIRERVSDTSLYPNGNPGFSIHSLSNLPVHYISTYTSTSTSASSLGLDLSSTASRRIAYQKAYASGQPVASGTVIFNLIPGQTPQTGFFITIPVAAEAAPNSYIGFVVVAFNYTNFFQHSFDRSGLLDGLDLKVTDSQGGSAVYTSNNAPKKAQLAYQDESVIPIENDSWKVDVMAPSNYSLNKVQLSTPSGSLFAGEAFSLLLLIIFVLLNSSRSRAMRLADAITEDLDRERQSVLTLARKDEAILSGIGEGLISFDTKGRVERVNAAALRMLGYKEDEMIGKHYSEVFRGADRAGLLIPNSERPLARALATGKTTKDEKPFSYFRKDGSTFPAHFNISPVIMHDKLIGVIEIFRDITKDLELDKQKDEFVSLTSHQLRTPLTAIRLFSEMLIDEQVGKLNAAQHDYMSKIADSTRRMIELVGDFLNNSRVDLGRLKVEPEPTHLEKLVEDYVTEIRPVADKKQISLVYESKTLPEVNIDHNLYGQIVHNLLTNAIRYTPSGGEVKVSLDHSKAGYDLSVSDNGIGIPKEAQAKLFQRFFRAENAVLVEGEGSGLGLYLIKKIVELVGGQIDYESVEHKGTTFHVIIPSYGMKPLSGEVSLTNPKEQK